MPARAAPVIALAIGILSGIVAWRTGLPLPWMLGPMIGVTLASLCKVPLAAPIRLRPIVVPIIGVMLGSGVSAQIFSQLGNWLLTLALMPPFLASAAWLSYLVYARLGGFDRVTAFYAAMPGGLNEMLIMGEEAGGNGRQIALAHAARVLLVISLVAFYFGYVLGVRTTGMGQWTGFAQLTALDYGLLGAAGVAGVALGQRLGLPAAPVFGPMILSGAAHLAGWVTVPPPSLLVIAAQIVMGTIIGARFVGIKPATVLRELRIAAVSAAAMLAVALLFAETLVLLSGVALPQAFLAYSPGGLTEMSLLTLAMQGDAAYVSVMHVIRISLVVAIAPFAFRWLRRGAT